MATFNVSLKFPITASAPATTLTRINVAGKGAKWLWCNGDVDWCVLYDDGLDDGATVASALPAPTAAAPGKYYRVPANVCHPIPADAPRILVFGLAGTALISIMAATDEPHPGRGPC